MKLHTLASELETFMQMYVNVIYAADMQNKDHLSDHLG